MDGWRAHPLLSTPSAGTDGITAMHPPFRNTTPVLYSASRWTIVFLPAVAMWFEDLRESDPSSAALLASALDVLSDLGPQLGRPLVDTLRGSSIANLKELRPGSRRNSETRLLFAFDPKRRAVVLTAGNKAGQWRTWYATHIPIAERRYTAWLAGDTSS